MSEMEKIEQQISGITNWLRECAPAVFKEQAHLDAGSVEQKYYHLGRLTALRDIRDLLPKATPDE